MRNTLRAELWKATHNKMFFLSLAVGLFLALADSYLSSLTVNELHQSTLEMLERGYGTGGHAGFSLFVLWMPINGFQITTTYFFLIWPALAAIPYGWSYCQERRSGVIQQIATRSNKRTYFNAKFLAVFISGGLAVMLPILINLLVDALICPYALPILGIVPVFNGNFLSALYYTNPWIYAICWCIMEFLFGGAAACLCFVVGSMLKFQVMTILVPLVLLTVFDRLSVPLFHSTNLTVSPLQMVAAASANITPGWVLFTALGIMLGISYVAGYWQVVKHEAI